MCWYFNNFIDNDENQYYSQLQTPTNEPYLEAAWKKMLAHIGGDCLDVDGKLRLLAIDRD